MQDTTGSPMRFDQFTFAGDGSPALTSSAALTPVRPEVPAAPVGDELRLTWAVAGRTPAAPNRAATYRAFLPRNCTPGFGAIALDATRGAVEAVRLAGGIGRGRGARRGSLFSDNIEFPFQGGGELTLGWGVLPRYYLEFDYFELTTWDKQAAYRDATANSVGGNGTLFSPFGNFG